jgi:hypothetical protein
MMYCRRLPVGSCVGNTRLGYRGDYHCLLDAIHGSFVCDDVRDMISVVQHFLDAADKAWQAADAEI